MTEFFFKGIKVSCCDLDSSVRFCFDYLKENNDTAYICVTDTGNVVNAHKRSPELKAAINNSLLSLPDGRPLSMFARLKGFEGIDRVAGPDFMKEIFKSTKGKEFKHFFLGDTKEVLERVVKRVVGEFGIQVCGTCSPALNENTDNINTNEEIVSQINSAEADFIWVALGGGKQEIWMMNNYNKLNKGIMTGVGAAFRFYLGDIKRAPMIFQKLGMEWFFRLVQQPGKMSGRYLKTLPLFMMYSAGEIFKSRSELLKK